MVMESSSEKTQPVSETVVQQSIAQQAQAAAAGQTDLAEPGRQEILLQNTDLITPDAGEDDVAPPAYGEVQGEIRNEKDGLGISVGVSDDGRVNIRINQLNRRLSQIFNPALRQQLQSVPDSGPPPAPYIPPSLGGQKGVPPPPPLSVVIQVVGSRGDVQPFIALGKVLQESYGHRVRLATRPNFKGFVQENGLEFFSIGGDPSKLMAFMVKNPSLMPGFRSVIGGDVSARRRDVAEYIQGCWRSCYQAGDGIDLSEPAGSDSADEPSTRPFVADCIIANPPSFAHIHCAEKLGIPLHIMFTMPYSPTQAFPHPLANIQSSNADPQLTNYMSYAMIEVLSWQGLGDIINRFRKKCLGLDPVSLIWAPGMLHRLKVPHSYCWSPALIPKPTDWGSHISVPGFYFLNTASNYSPPRDLQTFLDAGPPPVYIGFGSIVLDDPNAMTELIFDAVRKTGQRVLLSKGWGGMGADELDIPDGVFILGNVPHDWLFKCVSCVVHHGGAGTTAAGIAAGRPTLVVPFFGDQPFWGAMIARAGAGPDPIPNKQLTADGLAEAIKFCLEPACLERAQELANKIAAEQGSERGAQSFHQFLEVDRLRCSLAPSRPAAWRIKRTQVRLSPFAACTLANAKLLDFHDLKLFRPAEYNTDEGPWDPLSGGATAAFGVLSTMVMGLADFPSETWKALKMPARAGRRPSQKSVSTIARKEVASDTTERPTLPTSPEQSQTSLNAQGSLARVRSPLESSGLSSPTLSTVSSAISDSSHSQLKPNLDDGKSKRVHSRNESEPARDRDMLRQTGVHTSKGFGKMVTALVKAPMEMSVSMTKGFHNAPKLWGDDTVRPQQQVSGIKSGGIAIGKEFGYGMYDGITGLVTQPWKGAQKEGTSGFFKGIGKGIGGFATKPGAALFSVPSYFMKGAWKEVQKLYGSNVQNYIVATRTAQGYEEWLQSSEAEKQDVIDRWKLIQKHLKKKGDRDEILRDVLDGQQKQKLEEENALSANTGASIRDPEHAMLATEDSHSSEASLAGADIAMSRSSEEISHEEAEERGQIKRASGGPRPPLYDPGHLEGTTQTDFEARQLAQPGEKTTQERTEEEIVMEYVKKQSLLEAHHQGKGKDRATATEDNDEEDLQEALKLSMHEYEHGHGHGESSRI